MEEIARQWYETLGIEVECIPGKGPEEECQTVSEVSHTGWIADYPDPHNFLYDAMVFITGAQISPDYRALIEQAGQVHDRKRRMAMYRQADNWLVNDQVTLFPLFYGGLRGIFFPMPWVKGLVSTGLGPQLLKTITIEPHNEGKVG